MINKNIRYSTIIPAYNSEKTIKRCVDSLLNQKYENCEVIVVNDGSKDKTLEILNSYNDSRLKVIDIENHGVSYARNQALEIAAGEFVTFVDSDDWAVENYYEILDYLTHKYTADLYVCCAYKKVGNNPPQIWDMSYTSGEYFDLEPIYNLVGRRYCYPALWNKIFKNSIIKENSIRFNTDIIFSEDVFFNLEYVKYISSVYMTKLAIYHYYINSASVTFNQKLKYLRDRDLCAQTMLRFCANSEEKFNYKYNIYNIYIDKFYEILLGLSKNKKIKKQEVLKYLLNNKTFNELLEIVPSDNKKRAMQKAMRAYRSGKVWLFKMYVSYVNFIGTKPYNFLNKFRKLAK